MNYEKRNKPRETRFMAMYVHALVMDYEKQKQTTWHTFTGIYYYLYFIHYYLDDHDVTVLKRLTDNKFNRQYYMLYKSMNSMLEYYKMHVNA